MDDFGFANMVPGPQMYPSTDWPIVAGFDGPSGWSMQEWPGDSMLQSGINQMGGQLDQMVYGAQPGIFDGSMFTPFRCDRAKLQSLGFNPQDMDFLETLVLGNKNRFPSAQKLLDIGIYGNQATVLKYMYSISVGRVQINTPDDFAKHLKKMWTGRHLGIQDLPVSSTTQLLRYAVIAGLPAPFDVLNSKQYMTGGIHNAMYEVVSTGGANTVIKSKHKPVLEFGASRKIEGVIEIVDGPDSKGYVQYKIDNKHVRMCNRYVIAASLRRPNDHLGYYRLLCIDGTAVYVVALQVESGSSKNYYSQSQRIYRYGVDAKGIEKNLRDVAKWAYEGLHCVFCEQEPGTIVYQQLLDNEAMAEERRKEAEQAFAESEPQFDELD